MPLRKSNLEAIPISFASVSIGCKAEHKLPKKIDAIAAAGFKGIELGFPDLVSFATQELNHNVDSTDYEDLCVAAQKVKSLCDAHEMSIMLLQPFANFEGWPDGSDERKDAFDRARGWINVMLACGCDTLQVGSSDTPASSIGMDRDRFVSDLRQLCDMLAQHHLRLAYENWCWSTHAPDWKDVWDIVERVDRPNIGLCLDTFQTGGGEWADPTTSTGLIQESGQSAQQIQERFNQSLAQLSSSVPADKIYLLQISDAYKPKKPFDSRADDNGLRPRGRWSQAFRPVPFAGGYLPVTAVTEAVLKTGFRGWFSYEVFDAGPDGIGKSYELQEFANEAADSHRKLMQACLDLE